MRLIDVDALDFTIPKNPHFMTETLVQVLKNAIDKASTIDPESLRPQGEWITKSWWQRKTKYTVNVCSICKSNVKPKLKPNYCPNCGAVMREEQDGR